MIKLGLRKSKKSDNKTEKQKVEERREEVLSKGRKFKYPLQYAKHKLVFNTIIISVVAVFVLIVLGWAMLYKFQNTGDVIYRLTRFLPIPVATVDGADVRFSDYLMLYRSSLQAIEQQSGQLGDGEDADSIRTDYKKTALDSAERYAFALKKANELGITVSNDEIADMFDNHRKVGGAERNEESFLKVISDNFGLSKNEYERLLYLSLIREKVEMEIDVEANEIASSVERILLENGGNYVGVKEQLGDKIEYEETGGLVDNKNIDGGRASKAATMRDGEQSGKFLSSNGDGYYFVKLISKTDTKVNYVSLKVKFSKFQEEFLKIKESEGIQEFISLE